MAVFIYDHKEAEAGGRLYRIAKDLRENSRRLEDTLEAFRMSEASDPLYGLMALAIIPTKAELSKQELDEYEALQFYQRYKDSIEHEQYPSSESVIIEKFGSPGLIHLANISWEVVYKPRDHRIRVDEGFLTMLEITMSMIKMQEK